MTKERIIGTVRHILTFGGGFLVSKGTLDEGTMIEGVGLISGIAGLLWSIFAPEKK